MRLASQITVCGRLPLQFLHLVQRLYPCSALTCDLLWTTLLLWPEVKQQGPPLSQLPLHPQSLILKKRHGEEVRGVVHKADASGSLWECFFLEDASLALHHSLHCHQFHPRDLCLLPSIYRFTYLRVLSSWTQHEQWWVRLVPDGWFRHRQGEFVTVWRVIYGFIPPPLQIHLKFTQTFSKNSNVFKDNVH